MDYSGMLTPIIGYTLDKEYAVYSKDFDVAYFPSYEKKNSSKRVSIQDNQVWIETRDGQRFAFIYSRNRIYVPTLISHKCEGIVEFVNFHGDELPDKVKEIIFYGGCLDYLFDKQRPVIVRTDINILEVQEDRTLKYVEQGKEANRTFIVGTYQRSIELNDFNTLPAKEVYFKIQFEKPTTLSELPFYYSLIHLLVRFMTNRYDVSFREVRLTTDVGRVRYPDGRLFVRDTTEMVSLVEGTCLTFQDLGWTMMNLLAIFTRQVRKNGKTTNDYSLDFIPHNEEIGYLRNETICNISGALEYEVSQNKDIKNLRDQEIDKFAREIRRYIKEKYKEYNVPEEALDLMCGSTQNWSLSAKERFIALADKHREAMEQLKKRIFDGQYYDIGVFVKHRNQVMHSASTPPTIEVVGTALILRGLVYCSILSRAGMSEEDITRLAKEDRINP